MRIVEMNKLSPHLFTCVIIALGGATLFCGCSKKCAWLTQTAGNHLGLLLSKRFQSDEILFKDYGHLEQFRQDDARLLPSNDRVVLVGDSITAFWADPSKSHLKEEEPRFIFRAVGGSTTGQMLLRFRQDVINLHPRIVVVLAGTNDILIRDDAIAFERFRNNVMTMSEMAEDRQISVILGSIPPQTDTGHKADPHHIKSIPVWNDWLRSYARSIGAGFTDYYPLLVGPEHEFRSNLTDDKIHPNVAGYLLMQKVLCNEVHRIELRTKNSNPLGAC